MYSKKEERQQLGGRPALDVGLNNHMHHSICDLHIGEVLAEIDPIFLERRYEACRKAKRTLPIR